MASLVRNVSLFLFDGFMGSFYLPLCFARHLVPSALFKEAFSSLHQRKHLPPIPSSDRDVNGSFVAGESMRTIKSRNSDAPPGADFDTDLEELQAFLEPSSASRNAPATEADGAVANGAVK